MGIMRKFENRMEDSLEGMASRMSNAPISPVKIAKKAEKQMQREKMVGAGKQYAPTLYTVLVNADDDVRLFGYYPTLAGETETYLSAKAEAKGLVMDGQPLVRFIADGSLRSGKFDVIAEAVAAPIVEQLRMEEMQRYGIAQASPPYQQGFAAQGAPENQNFGYQEPSYNDGYYAPDSASADAFNGKGGWSEQPQSPQSSFDDSGYGDSWHAAPHLNDGQEFSAAPNAQPMYDAAAPTPAPAAARAGDPMAAPATMVMGSHDAANAGNAGVAVFAKLVDTASGQNFIAHSQRSIIGRGTSSDIVLSDLNASRSHAELRLEPQGFWSIADLGSTNGTSVNGRRITSTQLQEGDIITIGMTNLAFSLR